MTDNFGYSAIENGPHTLAEPIDNPKPDKRVKRDWTAAEQYPAGRYIVRVRRETNEHGSGEDTIAVERQEFYVNRGSQTTSVTRYRRPGQDWKWSHDRHDGVRASASYVRAPTWTRPACYGSCTSSLCMSSCSKLTRSINGAASQAWSRPSHAQRRGHNRLHTARSHARVRR